MSAIGTRITARPDFEQQIAQRLVAESTTVAKSRGVLEYTNVKYKSSVDGMEIPASLYQPLQKRGPRGHAAMVWVHGGVHGSWWAYRLFPFVKEAIQRGYVIIAPEYRGSTGFGAAHYNAIDYGGKELDDVASAVEYLKTLPHVDPERIGIMGWSHGGYIASLLLFREQHPFKAGAAMVPVTNLVFRLGYKGPGYQWQFSTQKEVLGTASREEGALHRAFATLSRREAQGTDTRSRRDERHRRRLRRGPATRLEAARAQAGPGRDEDLRRSRAGTIERRSHVQSPREPATWERDDSPDQIDSWNRTWTFFDWWLRPYEDRSKTKM